jgi:hypothetical protein
MSKNKHLAVTWLMALGTNLSALWISGSQTAGCNSRLARNFNVDTMRMELTNFAEVVFSPVAQVKFVHTVFCRLCDRSHFSCWRFLAGICSKVVTFPLPAAVLPLPPCFGLASSLSVIILGDESGYEMGDVQKVKLAAIEAEWHTEPPPAAFTLVGLPNQATENHGLRHQDSGRHGTDCHPLARSTSNRSDGTERTTPRAHAQWPRSQQPDAANPQQATRARKHAPALRRSWMTWAMACCCRSTPRIQ